MAADVNLARGAPSTTTTTPRDTPVGGDGGPRLDGARVPVECEGKAFAVGATTSASAALAAAAAAAAAAATTVATWTGGDCEVGAIGMGLLESLARAMLHERADRPREDPVGDMPVELREYGLLNVWWQSLDAPSRHYIKRRVGKIRPKKLVLKLLDIASMQVAEDLGLIRVEADFKAVQQALLHAAPSWAADQLERSPPLRGVRFFSRLGVITEHSEETAGW